MTTFVMIPGGWHGGWMYAPLAARLRQAGHEAHAVTLSGLEETPRPRAGINLETHIADVVACLTREDLSEVILCAHSYGGMVATGVADRVPERLAALVYLDAFAPENGQSWWDLAGDEYRRFVIERAGHDGLTALPREGSDSRRRPHPLGTFIQALRLSRPQPELQRVFVYASGWSATPFTPQYERLRNDPAWQVRSLPCGHDVVLHAHEEVLQVLLDCARDVAAAR